MTDKEILVRSQLALNEYETENGRLGYFKRKLFLKACEIAFKSLKEDYGKDK